jgi:iron complex outermembrane receptor protein
LIAMTTQIATGAGPQLLRLGVVRRALRVVLLAIAAQAICSAGDGDAPLPPPGTLKKMTVEQLLDLDVTSVSRRPEKLFATASAIQVVTAEDVRRSGATSLPEALRLASNLEVAQIDARQWAITARGFNNVFADKMLVQIDGRSVYTPLYAGVYWDVQDAFLYDLDRIEVISGPGATQWGANAVNGVINITTKSARDTQGGVVVAGGGTELRHSVGVRYGGRTGRGVYYRVYANHFERGDSVRPSGRASNDAWRMSTGGFRADWEAGPTDALTLQGDAYNGSMGQVGPDLIRVNGANLLGRWSRTLGPRSDCKLQLYFDHTHRRIPRSFTEDLNTSDLDFQHRFPLGSAQDVVWGVGYRRGADDIVNTHENAFLPPRATREWFNAFVQDEIAISPDRLALTAGSKVEHNDYTGAEYEPSVRLAFTPDRQKTIWAAVSRAVRTPSRIDRDLFSPATPPYRVAGGTNVVSEKLIAYETGFRLQLDPQLAVSLAAFINDYDDLRSLEPLNPPSAFPVQASSQLRGRSTGAELTAEWRPAASWRLRTGYTEMRVRSEPQPGSGARGTRDSIARDPNHQLHLRSLWDISARWELDIDLRYISPIHTQAVPGYTEGSVRLGWNPAAEWEFSLIGQNLLHAHHPEFNAVGGRREIQRGLYARASWRF